MTEELNGAPGSTDVERAAWLADKIGALGDYAKEAAEMLRRWPADGHGDSGADWLSVGTVRVHRTGGNAGIAWSVEESGVMVRDGETLYVKGNVSA